MSFSRSVLAQAAAMTVINVAKDEGVFDENTPINVAPELAEAEHQLFLKMFERIKDYISFDNKESLNDSEISSMFTFVFAKAAEAVTNMQSNQENKFEMLGMFDGKIPIYAHDIITGYFKKLSFPTSCAESFLIWYHQELKTYPNDVDPIIILFEALKWTFRFSCHIAIERLNGER